jgi:YD repeat-containing protein
VAEYPLDLLEAPCPFCGEEMDFAGLDVLGSFLDWTPCCLSAREAVEVHGFEGFYGVSILDAVRQFAPCVREYLQRDGDDLVRCRLSAYDPGYGVSGWRAEAFAEVTAHHRHHDAPQGWKFGAAVENGLTRVGVATVGRPVSRKLAEKEPRTLEVTRVCTWGDRALRRNAASKLYGTVARRARSLGYSKLITYTLAEEDGASLRAAGFKPVAVTEARTRGWDRDGRRREVTAPTGQKTRWERVLFNHPERKHRERRSEMKKAKAKAKVKKFTARKYNGDDCYSWAVFRAEDVKGTRGIVGYGRARPVMSGLSRSSARFEVRELNAKAKREAAQENCIAPELSAEEQVLVARWLTVSNLGQPEPKAPTADAINDAYRYCAEVHGAEGIDISEEYQSWLKDCRNQQAFVREQWAEFKSKGVA